MEHLEWFGNYFKEQAVAIDRMYKTEKAMEEEAAARIAHLQVASAEAAKQ